jgi:hypothetical protein
MVGFGGTCVIAKHDVVSDAKYISLVLWDIEKTFSSTRKLLKCFFLC